MNATFVTSDNQTLISQIGRMNVLAISGGRVLTHNTGVILPVAYGHKVAIDLSANDSYTVRHTYTRGAKVWIKREWTDVHASEVGNIAYEASLYNN
jgi:hypothetical protein